MKWSESEIQGLKSQEAKDLCIQLLDQLRNKEKAPISPGEVQLKELEYDLQLKEAEAEDNRQHEAHLQQVKELELQIEQERTRQAEAASHADVVRQDHARVVERVETSQEVMSIQLERATREHRLKLENLEAEFSAREDALRSACDELKEEKTRLSGEISELSQLQETANDIHQLREELESRQTKSQRLLQELEQALETSAFDKNKQVRDIERQQELELAELEATHKRHVIELDRKAADKLLSALGMIAVNKDEWEQQEQAGSAEVARSEEELAKIHHEAKEAFRREYNITTNDTIDVTDLFYSHKTLANEADSLRKQLDKLDAEIKRMREHIEQEPHRIATAVEAAKVHIQNTIEQGAVR